MTGLSWFVANRGAGGARAARARAWLQSVGPRSGNNQQRLVRRENIPAIGFSDQPLSVGFRCKAGECDARPTNATTSERQRHRDDKTAQVWMLEAMVWMLRATMWMLGATVWMLGATVWMLGAMVTKPRSRSHF
eukprot:1194000-Prorocentrum_minimum.AAC.2